MFSRTKRIIVKYRDTIERKWINYWIGKRIFKNTNDNQFNVAFIVYEPTMWDKLAPVYNALNSKNIAKTTIIVQEEITDNPIKAEEIHRKVEYFKKQYPSCILVNRKNIKEIKRKWDYQYVFYQTPYVFKIIKGLRPVNIVRKSRICYIPYAYIGSKDFYDVSSRLDFFQAVYYSFMDSEPMKRFLIDKLSKNGIKKHRNVEYVGYPALEVFLKADYKKNIYKNVLWTPRWSYAEKGGGSHFLEYHECIEKAVLEFGIDLTIRPHPHMLTSLVNEGYLTNDNVNCYLEHLKTDGIKLDINSDLNESLFRADILIADYSSILICYFLTGKPIIYCEGGVPLYDKYEIIRDSLYVAYNQEDINKYLKLLTSGEDPLREKRKEIIENGFDENIGATERIIEYLVKDYHK